MARIWELPTDYTKLTRAQRREDGKCSHCMEPLEANERGLDHEDLG